MLTQRHMVFLDRDGVINGKDPDVYFVQSPSQFKFLPGVFQAIRLLNSQGCYVVVVTNQRGVSTGAHTEEELLHLHDFMLSALWEQGVVVDAIYYCPHAAGMCSCRKPQTGLFERAFDDFPDVVPGRSFMVGDSLSDMEAAHRLGCRKVLIASDAGPVIAAAAQKDISIEYCAASLLNAVHGFILPVLARGEKLLRT